MTSLKSLCVKEKTKRPDPTQGMTLKLGILVNCPHFFAIVINYRKLLQKSVVFTFLIGLAHIAAAIIPLLAETKHHSEWIYLEIFVGSHCLLAVIWKKSFLLYTPILANMFLTSFFLCTFFFSGIMAIFPRFNFAQKFMDGNNLPLIQNDLFNHSDYRISAVMANLAIFGAFIVSVFTLISLLMSLLYFRLLQKIKDKKIKKYILPLYTKTEKVLV